MSIEQAIKMVLDGIGNLDIKATKNNVGIITMANDLLGQVLELITKPAPDPHDAEPETTEE